MPNELRRKFTIFLFILAENIRVFAHHGTSPEERALGSEYVVSVRIQTDFAQAARNDQIEGTVNYESVYMLVRHEMEQPSDLLETVCFRILNALTETFAGIKDASVRILRHCPPVEANVGLAFVEMALDGKARVGLEDVRLFALHGLYAEEAVAGNWYSLDCWVAIDGKKIARADNISGTVNYESLFWILKYEMAIRAQLLERVAERIRDNILEQFPSVHGFHLRLGKIAPPIDGRMGRASIVLEENLLRPCPRCKTPFSCPGKPENCWCKDINVFPMTRQTVREQYKGCVCEACLRFYAS